MPKFLPKTTAPKAVKRSLTQTFHGVQINDEYAWLRDANWQDVVRDPSKLDASIRAYLEAENAYTDDALAPVSELRQTLFTEMKARLKPDDSAVPSPDGPYAYYSRYATGGQYPLLCRTPREGGAEAVLLDGNAEAKAKRYWQLQGYAHSGDHRLLAYAIDEAGSEMATIRIRDLASGSELPDVIADTSGAIVWAADSRTFYYVKRDENLRPHSVWRHEIGTPESADRLIFTETDPGFFVGIGETQSRRFLVISAEDHQASEVHLVDLHQGDAEPFLVSAREAEHEYAVEHAAGGAHGDRLIITTNRDGAEDFKICEAPITSPGPEHWRALVPHQPGRLILDTAVFRGHLVRFERENGLPRIVITDLTSGTEHAISFDEEAYALGMDAGYEFDTTLLRFSYASMTTPTETYDYDMATRTRSLRKRQEIPSGHNPAAYTTRRVFATAFDGEKVPISLLYRNDTPLDGSAPLFLYGYGAYGHAMPASFATARLSLVDRGFIFAIAHVRGGKDKGFRWYRGGKLKKKVNSFTDFIAAGEHLVTAGLTQRGRIVANGGSAGGLLVGAAVNMAPDLFLGVIADVPFVDVLNTMLDETLPLTPREFPEWGHPAASAEDFETIRSYSPYDNVTAKAYPHILALGGLTDPRVTYWEPAKWIAKLRDLNTSDSLILLKTNMSAGHGGASGRFEALKEVALDYAFALLIAGRTA